MNDIHFTSMLMILFSFYCGLDPLNGPTHLEDKPEDELEEDGTAGEEKTISKYRMLIQEIHEKQDKKKSEDVDMEISWDIGKEQLLQKIS